MADIVKLRTDKNLTQQQLADKVGVIRQTISEIECGRNKPSISLAKKLAEVLGIPWTDFFEE